MSGKITTDQLMAALVDYQATHPEAKIDKISEDNYMITEAGSSVGVELKDGSLSCPRSQTVKDSLLGFVMDHAGSPNSPIIPNEKGNTGMAPRKSNGGPLAKPEMTMRDLQVADLTFEDVKNFLCPAAPDKDAYMFLQLCKARNLNPFTNEAYLIPYKDKNDNIKCSIIVGKEAFMRKAEQHQQFRGFKAGVILAVGEELVYREGTFTRKGEALEGGWAEVYRADRDHSVRAEVSFHEYNQNRNLWTTKPATMIRKVALVQALREAFATDLAGCYDRDEMGLNPENEVAA